jgi:hypothetical protein
MAYGTLLNRDAVRRDSDEMHAAVGAAHASDLANVRLALVVTRPARLVDQYPIATSEEAVFVVMLAVTRFYVLDHFMASQEGDRRSAHRVLAV